MTLNSVIAVISRYSAEFWDNCFNVVKDRPTHCLLQKCGPNNIAVAIVTYIDIRGGYRERMR